MFGGVGIYLYLCGAVCGTFAAIDGCDETREQPRTAADGNERGGRGWLLTETKEGSQGWLLTRRKEDAMKSRLTRKGMQRWVWMVLTGQ